MYTIWFICTLYVSIQVQILFPCKMLQRVPQTSLVIWPFFLRYVYNMCLYTYSNTNLNLSIPPAFPFTRAYFRFEVCGVFLCGNMLICVSYYITPISDIIEYRSFAFRLTSCSGIISRLICGASKNNGSIFQA